VKIMAVLLLLLVTGCVVQYVRGGKASYGDRDRLSADGTNRVNKTEIKISP
jgi:hypothetical protein